MKPLQYCCAAVPGRLRHGAVGGARVRPRCRQVPRRSGHHQLGARRLWRAAPLPPPGACSICLIYPNDAWGSLISVLKRAAVATAHSATVPRVACVHSCAAAATAPPSPPLRSDFVFTMLSKQHMLGTHVLFKLSLDIVVQSLRQQCKSEDSAAAACCYTAIGSPVSGCALCRCDLRTPSKFA